MIRICELNKLYFIAIILILTLISGCQEPKDIPVKICPGKTNVTQALKALKDSSVDIQPFIAYGKGLVQFYNQEKKKYKDEPISAIKIWFEPPGKFRFHGDVIFNNRGLDVGSNDAEFWFTAMPKELGNIYIWGLWSQQKNEEELLLSPRIMRQAFGVIDITEEKNFSLVSHETQDILVEKDKKNKILKKIYINNCNYRVSKIEYYNNKQVVFAVLELTDYKIFNEKILVPTKIQIINNVNNGNPDMISIILKSVKVQDTIKSAIFRKPPTKRYKNIYKLVNGKVIKESK